MTDNLNTVLYDEKFLKIQGEDIVLTPIRIGQLKEALKSARVVAPFLFGFIESGKIDFMTLSNHLDDIQPIVQVMTGKNKDWFDNLNALELVQIVCAVIELNYNFFFLKVIPELTKTTDAITKKLSGQTVSRN